MKRCSLKKVKIGLDMGSTSEQQQNELGLVKAAPLRYAAFTSRLCWALGVKSICIG